MKPRSFKRPFPFCCQDQCVAYYCHGGQAKHTEAAGIKNVKIILEPHFGSLNETGTNVVGLQRGTLTCSVKHFEHHGFANVL